MAERNVSTISLAACESILKKVGASRVSHEAAVAFSEMLREIADEISSKAVEIAKHSGRKTVHSADINLAAK